jgi:hypothetical protein
VLNIYKAARRVKLVWRQSLKMIYIMSAEKFGRARSNKMRRVQRPKTKDQRPKIRSMLLLIANCLLLTVFCLDAQAQQVVDKMVATVDSGGRVDLITYSDLLWQIALQPETPIETPGSAELNRVLNLLINQRLIFQEADKLPTIAPTDKEITDYLTGIINRFPTRAEFQRRAELVGLSTEQMREIARQRLLIEKYLDFRFRSFVVITAQEVADYYRDVFVPRLRQKSPGQIVPALETVREQLEQTLTEEKIEADTDAFIENARANAEITILNQV